MRMVLAMLANVLLLLSCVNGYPLDSCTFQLKANAYMAGLVAQREFSGVVSVEVGGRIAFEKAYGLANVTEGISLSTNAYFRLGSITKQVTAMCILILQEQQKINVTNLISQYIPNCPKTWNAITIHHLLTHSSGIPDCWGPGAYPKRFSSPITLMSLFDVPLEFEPGEKMEYSNTGYTLLGRVIENVSRKAYEEFVLDEIIRPLGMKDSGFGYPTNSKETRTFGYRKQVDQTISGAADMIDLSNPAAGLYSTVGDVLLWHKALCSDVLVSKRSLNLMFTPFRENYCYGWRFFGRAYGHGGKLPGFSSFIFRHPADETFIIVLSNYEWVPTSQIALDLFCMLGDSE